MPTQHSQPAAGHATVRYCEQPCWLPAHAAGISRRGPQIQTPDHGRLLAPRPQRHRQRSTQRAALRAALRQQGRRVLSRLQTYRDPVTTPQLYKADTQQGVV
ncbi:uncharacterized protein LOC126298642 [Schistocerca gregaria]|uniref:uncharacterized protein LOC126298642 n=1 Tax=Schistocerca gregaria TaxID=7010 RepID=UPI00211E56A1|nr:uncharacterized protein LOC126298642 [Schistocerca gregaria]